MGRVVRTQAGQARAAQEDEEWTALDIFRKASRLLSGGVTRGLDPPDFLIEDGARRIAVEMTRYHQEPGPKGSPLAKREADENRIVTKALQIFEAANPNVHLMVDFYFGYESLSRRNVVELPTLLADAVTALIPPLSTTEGATTTEADYRDPKLAPLRTVLLGIHVLRSRSLHRNIWDSGSGGRYSVDAKELETVIRTKEVDLPRYRKGADECWLIIYALPQGSALFDSAVLTPHMWKSTFDRVVFIDILLGQFVLLV
jgi:hypothetical protein